MRSGVCELLFDGKISDTPRMFVLKQTAGDARRLLYTFPETKSSKKKEKKRCVEAFSDAFVDAREV